MKACINTTNTSFVIFN